MRTAAEMRKISDNNAALLIEAKCKKLEEGMLCAAQKGSREISVEVTNVPPMLLNLLHNLGYETSVYEGSLNPFVKITW